MVKHDIQHEMAFKDDKPVSPEQAEGFGFPLNYDDREMVWEELKRLHGDEWPNLDQHAKQALSMGHLKKIIGELKAMNGDIWQLATPEERRMLFRARFFGKSGKAKLNAPEPAAKQAFPPPESWIKQNESMLKGMTAAEKEQLYRKAAAKAAKP